MSEVHLFIVFNMTHPYTYPIPTISHSAMKETYTAELGYCDTNENITYLADIYKEPRNSTLCKLFCRVRFLREVYLSWECRACGLRVTGGVCPLKCESAYIFKANASCVITDGTGRAYLYLDNEHLVMSLLRVSQDCWNRMKELLKISGKIIYQGRDDDEARYIIQNCPLSEQGELLRSWCRNPKVCEHMTLFAIIIQTRDPSSYLPKEACRTFKESEFKLGKLKPNDKLLTWTRSIPSLKAIQVDGCVDVIFEAHRLAKDLENWRPEE